MSHSPRRLLGAATAAALLAGVTQLPVDAAPTKAQSPAATETPKVLEDADTALADLDVRGKLAPSLRQKAAARSLGGLVRWNSFGTPASIAPLGGSLGRASGSPVTAARSWLKSHAGLFGTTSTQMSRLVLVNDQKLVGSSGHAVLFRQDFGGPAPAIDSMVTVGIGNGAVQYVSSSLARATATSVPAASLTPTQAWQKAAANIGRAVATGDITGLVNNKLGWTRFKVAGFAQEQQVRLRSLVSANGTVRPVFEANVVDVQGAKSTAYTTMVDAVSGKILVRQNKVDQSSDAPTAPMSEGTTPFNGSITATACGPMHPFTLTDANTRSIVATAAEVNTANDIVVKIFGPDKKLLTSGDNGTSPEFATYSAAAIPAGKYTVQVCPFKDPTAPFIPPGDYAGTVTTSDQATSPGGDTLPYPPKWAYFLANPTLSSTDGLGVPKNHITGCWVHFTNGAKVTGCDDPPGDLNNIAARGPWDVDFQANNTPTFTTIGNAANDHEAWFSPLTPGGLEQAPVSPTRDYTDPFTDAWNNSKCDRKQLVPGGNDILASVTNLFVSHNRIHDWSYILGFTEKHYNLQSDNFGNGGDPSRENDPEIGNDQAGAISGGAPSYLGRDNANQIALQDGVPGITNQYLFQPIAGAFYSPCTDGALDMSIVGHEYTHAISNRMIGGPDQGISSEQGGAMGESWSDLDAQEYMYENGYATGTNPWAVGPYATGNKTVGIRDYAINKNPLNYSDYGFDTPGVEVHADGEIWNGTNWEVRQALVNKWNSKYPYSNDHLQRECSRIAQHNGPRRPIDCPGNRRWIQLMFDSFLLQQGATSMLDARDAMLGADRIRFHGDNQTVMWNAFARRGMGSNASTPSAESGDPKGGFATPRAKNATVTFKGISTDGSATPKGKVYVGDYEARVTPVADTDSGTALPSSARFTAGTYRLTYVAPGKGISRWTMTVKAGQQLTKKLSVSRNLASAKNGAKVIGTSAGSLNEGALIDDTEATNWAGGVDQNASVDASHPFVSVDLAGSTARTIKSVRVSALLRPAPASATDVPLLAVDDPNSGKRFTALRKFAVEVCTSGCSSSSATWKRIYSSSAAAFPGEAPRPVAPNLTLRSFNVPDTKAKAVRLVALENQCTGTPAYAGEQDNDPSNATDCKKASDEDLSVRAAELEVF